MSKVTLLDAAGDLDAAADEREVKYAGYLTGKRLRERDNLRAEAALVRAADAVVKAAGNRLSLGWHMSCSPNACRCGQTELDIALAAFHKIERGE